MTKSGIKNKGKEDHKMEEEEEEEEELGEVNSKKM